MKIVIPIAGRGSRFKKVAHLNAEYQKPKPFINVKGYPMVRWATGSLPFVLHKNQKRSKYHVVTGKDIVFVALEEHEKEFGISKELQKIYGTDVNIVFIPEVTRGAAETVLMAKDYINNEESLLISDSDHFIDGNAVMTGIQTYSNSDGIIPVFHSNDPKWSFSRVNKDGYVDLVAEKQPVSEWANIGAYYFKRGRDFVSGIEEMIKNNELTNNEFYVAPVYNKLIEKGMKIKLVVPEYVYGLGTPDDLEYFIKNTHFVL